MKPGNFDQYHTCIVANVSWIAGTKAQRLRGEEFVTSIRFHACCCLLLQMPATDGERWMRGRGKVWRWERCSEFYPCLLTGKWPETSAAAAIRFQAYLCLTDDSTLTDSLRPAINHTHYSFILATTSFINGLIRFFCVLTRLHSAHLQNSAPDYKTGLRQTWQQRESWSSFILSGWDRTALWQQFLLFLSVTSVHTGFTLLKCAGGEMRGEER